MSMLDTKAAEQARLSELFKLLTSRRPLSVRVASDAPMSDLRDAIPEELDPILKRLSPIIGARNARTRPRGNIVASILTHTRQAATTDATDMPVSDEESDNDEDDAESLANFPLAAAKKYPFTFKLMIYKLYKKDEWVKAVKEMLEKSKNEFKPLAEQEDVVYAGAKEAEENQPPVNRDGSAVRFKLPIAPAGRRGSVLGGRQRGVSVSTAGSLNAPRSPAAYPRSPFPKSPDPTAAEVEPEARVLKKRCIGRRRSMNGPLNAEAGKVRGTWVYNAAVSASERPAPAAYASFPPAPPPSPTSQSHSASYAPLGAKKMPSTLQSAAVAKRRVSEGGRTVIAPMLMPLGQITNKDRLVARRRAMTFDATERDEMTGGRKAAKRPFAG